MSDEHKDFLSIKTFSDLASFLGLSTKELGFLAYSKKSFYRSFYIPKKDGKGARRIDAPHKNLREIQRALAEVFAEVYIPRDSTYGFVRNRNIAGNAAQHTRKRWVAKIDLEDFFSSISSGRIRGLFLAAPFEFDDKVANTLTNLVCHKGSLPQGAPTSPVLSNMICFKMDRTFQQYARSNGLKYTRYADDLTFSSTKKSAVLSIASAEGSGQLIVNESVRRIVSENGFEINGAKTGLFGRGTRQVVTGIVVNEKCNFRRDDYRYLRSLFHHWKRHDEESAARYYTVSDSRHRYISRLFSPEGEYLEGKLPAHVRGILGYYSMIESANGRCSEPLQRLWTGFHDLTGDKVPEMLPERSVLRTDSFYTYREPGKKDCEDDGGVGSAFVLEGIGLLTACHCVKNITKGAQYEEYCLYIESHHSMNCKVKMKSFDSFTCNVADDWALAKAPPDFQFISGLPVAAKTFSLQRGEKVVGYGYADGKDQLRRIEARVAEIFESEIVVDRAFIKGMSGGPVLNSRGEAVGVITQGSGEGTYNRDGRFLLLGAIPVVAKLLG